MPRKTQKTIPETPPQGAVPKRKGNSGSFKPGNRANPRGRPKKAKDLRDALARHVPAAIDALGEMVRNERHRDRARAAVAILDRYYGTPIQVISGDLTITHALAEIEQRIVEHDPSWIPSTTLQVTDARQEMVRSEPAATAAPAGADSPDRGAATVASGETETDSRAAPGPAD